MRNSFYLIILFLIFVFIFLIPRSNFKGEAEIIFFDIGQGDSFALRTPRGKIILIDGGLDWSPLYYLGKWMGFFKKEIDILLLTHDHSDHISALPEIIKRYKVKNIFLPSRLNSFASKEILDKNFNAKIYYPHQEMCLDLEDNCFFCVIPPTEDFIDHKDENEISLAIIFDCANLSVFAAGDAGKARERSFLNSDLFQSVKVLKVSHHGSETSSDLDFLKALKPEIALISVGENNRYSHPNKSVIDRLKSLGIKIWRTDRDGYLRVFSRQGLLYYKNN